MKNKHPSQVTLVLEYMKEHGSITQKQADDDLGVRRLTSRIDDLKRLGFVIEDEWIKVPNRYGGVSRVKRYRLGQ